LGRARVSSTGQRFGTAGTARPYGTRQTRIGSAIFFKDCETQILKRYIYLATNLPTSVVRDADAARLCNPFETHCNIDPVTKDIVFFDNNITDVNADAEFDLLVLRHVDILFGHAALNFVGTSHGVDHAGELGNSAVPGILDNTSVMLNDLGSKIVLLSAFSRASVPSSSIPIKRQEPATSAARIAASRRSPGFPAKSNTSPRQIRPICQLLSNTSQATNGFALA
jgi:hypothetical protein